MGVTRKEAQVWCRRYVLLFSLDYVVVFVILLLFTLDGYNNRLFLFFFYVCVCVCVCICMYDLYKIEYNWYNEGNEWKKEKIKLDTHSIFVAVIPTTWRPLIIINNHYWIYSSKKLLKLSLLIASSTLSLSLSLSYFLSLMLRYCFPRHFINSARTRMLFVCSLSYTVDDRLVWFIERSWFLVIWTELYVVVM